jgi:hypothetical protein
MAPTSPKTTFLDRQIQRLIESRDGRGSLLPLLFDLSPRLQWWSLVMLTRQLPPLPWPKMTFVVSDSGSPMKILEDCLRGDPYYFGALLEWLLFMLGLPNARPPLTDTNVRRHFEAHFDLAKFLESPGDWFGHYFETRICTPKLAQKGGVFFTPQPMCDMIVGLLNPSLTQSVHEPAAGSGRLLLSASNYSVIHLLLSGLRVSELVGLRMDDISVTANRGQVEIRGEHVKRSAHRMVPLGRQARLNLKAYIDAEAPAGFAFRGQRGPLTASGVDKIVRGYGSAVGIRTHPHLLRHQFAELYLNQNPGDLVGLQQILGHASVDTTARHYVRKRFIELENGVNKIDL